jgi:site-specific recombinase
MVAAAGNEIADSDGISEVATECRILGRLSRECCPLDFLRVRAIPNARAGVRPPAVRRRAGFGYAGVAMSLLLPRLSPYRCRSSPDRVASSGLLPNSKQHLREGVDAFVAAVTLSARIDAFEALVRATRRGGRDDGPFDELLDLLDDAGERRRFHVAIAALIIETDGTNAFADAGIPTERGLLAELGERVMNRVLPRPRDDRDLGYLIRRLFRTRGDAERLARLPDLRWIRLANALYPADNPKACERLRAGFADGFRLLATWVQAQGLSRKLRARCRPCDLTESPFYCISRASDSLVTRWLSGGMLEREAAAWRRDAERCRHEMVEIHTRLECDGVSTDVVYGLEVVERCLARMAAMVDVMAPRSHEPEHAAMRRVMVALATSAQQDWSVFGLLQWNTRLLQRRIVERSGRTGEHYVTATRAEYRHLWLAAAGGGLLTVGTAVIKTALAAWHVSDFLHGVAYGLNYALSFLLLQRLGLVLATKQPAMTAAALAAIVRERRGDDRANEIAAYAARICRSQLAAVVANVVVASVGAFAFVHLWQWVLGYPFMSHDDAASTYLQLSPVNSGTVFYAALTGIILWLASVAGGWFDNFCAYHRLPLAIEQRAGGPFLTRERLARWSESLARNGAGWATNVSLGFMLGMTPAIGKFLGLPLDVRHVTLNAGILSLATASLGGRWFGEGAFLLGVAGVGVMFVLNLSVSFLPALITAARAYELPAKDNADLLRALFRRFRRAPLEFFIPPPAGDASGAPLDAKTETIKSELEV